ncbi:MAG: bifunctional phosphoglucose/phosphomannose isomerase [Candidatus Omnitrophica bacterium]|nr:bifunctional phosphoglucose/phosphomannose isomerase [Candidatus Omnitrophota bacterium]MCM8776817.1 bifunctional phosphoglucose/phosphomannose isomerase [Candidatus Omnitrophota bacterium]
MTMSMEDIKMLDKQDMLGKLKGFASQCKDGYSFTIPVLPFKSIEKVIFAGMGGSAISGDIIATIASKNSKIPSFVNRDYTLPLWAHNERTLVVAISYSGNTEETLSVLEEAKKRKNSIVCISSGGKIEKIAREENIPFLKIPSGYPPRCALGYLFFSCYKIMENIGLVPPLENKLFIKMEKWIERFLPESNNNLAKNIAEKLHNKVGIFYSSNKFIPVITRWKTQIAENSKAFAFINVFPEMNHNEIMSWRYPEWFIERCLPVFITSRKEHPRIELRFKITKDIIFKKQPEIISLVPEGEDIIEELFYFIILGDWVSFYLAIMNNENPTEIAEINLLKQKLGG